MQEPSYQLARGAGIFLERGQVPNILRSHKIVERIIGAVIIFFDELLISILDMFRYLGVSVVGGGHKMFFSKKGGRNFVDIDFL